ncbi:MAG TPA: HDIG domain-containing protein, partial [Armatimonadetes bacterium]|nr:HDIG domain-containing protein [Armatimonadota bacterium]
MSQRRVKVSLPGHRKMSGFIKLGNSLFRAHANARSSRASMGVSGRRVRHRWILPRVQVSWQKVVLGLIVMALLFIMIAPRELFLRITYVPGDVFPTDIHAWRTVEYVSWIETEQARNAAAKAVQPVYRRAPDVDENVLETMRLTYSHLRRLAELDIPLEQKLERAKRDIVIELPDDVIVTCLRASPDILSLMEKHTLSLIQWELDKGIRQGRKSIAQARQRIEEMAGNLNLRPAYRNAVVAIAKVVLQPNLVYDGIATQRRRQRAMESITPVRRRIRAGQLIARKGDVVRNEHLEMLRALGLNYIDIFASALVAILLTAGVGLIVHRFFPTVMCPNHECATSIEVRDREILRRLTILMLVWMPLLLVHYVLSTWMGFHEGAFALVSTAAMITCILFDSPLLASVLAALASIVVGIVALRDPQLLYVYPAARALISTESTSIAPVGTYAFEIVAVTFTAALTGIYAIAALQQRAQLITAGGLVGVTTFIGRLLLGLVLGPISTAISLPLLWAVLRWEFVLAVVTGIVAPAFTLAGVAIFERLFGMVTVFTLLELANTSAGLMRELAEKAPGTYQGSLMVATLARAAAEAIGANPLLTYVGGLYHDIGKLKRPNYFFENQRGVNPHDKLTPSLSAQILREHVEEGIRLAEEHRLPEVIIDFIREHHGTSLMQFFYGKALSDEGRKDEVEDITYR